MTQDQSTDGAPDKVATVAEPLEASMRRAEEIGSVLRDDDYAPTAARLRTLGIDPDLHPAIAGHELTSTATVYTAACGGSLRTFSGGLAHENGWWPSRKRRRLQHWEGSTARDFIVRSECDLEVEWLQSEGIAFYFYLAPRWHYFTADALMSVNGVRHVVEIKRTERDLLDPEYRMVLAAIAEICRRCGWTFRIVVADDIYAGRLHRANCELISMRRFVRIGHGHVRAMEAHAMRHGSRTTFGDLVEALEPNCIPRGEAVVHALVVARRVEIDLTRRLLTNTEITIH